MSAFEHETDRLVLVMHHIDATQQTVEVWERESGKQLCLDIVNLTDAAARQHLISSLPPDLQQEGLAGAMALGTCVIRGDVAPLDGLELTDAGNARRFAQANADRLRYCHAQKGWYAWDGRRWARDESGVATRTAKAFTRSEKDAAAVAIAKAPAESEAERRACAWLGHAVKSQTRRGLDAIEVLARDEEPLLLDATTLDADPWLLNCLNGTLDLRTGELRDHRVADHLSKLTPIAFEPEASCPRWVQFLLEVMNGRPEMVEYLHRAVGWTLTGDISEQTMFFLHGLGANGKSTFIAILRALLGEYAVETDASTFLVRSQKGVRDDLARLWGARLVSCAETDAGERLSEALIKQVTGGEPITARPLYGKYMTFQPAFKLWMASNHTLRIDGVDEGIWRRIGLIPFEATIPVGQRDPKLEQTLRQELPGILAWAVQGCLAWQQHRLAVPDVAQQATAQYRSDEDILGEFLEECIEMAEHVHTPRRAVSARYDQWCRSNGMTPISPRNFGRSLRERGWNAKKSNGAATWYGVQLRPVL
jgi:putative DNA primase/helicase